MADALGLTPKEAAGRLGIATKTLSRWRNMGAIGGYLTPGNRWRYRPSDVDDLVRRMRVEPTLAVKLP